ncbi:MAG TPA: hypothetical protein VFC76_01190 [Oscillospiraceae bacterium]|nr:hypothetical protein [Oscillospiraceae bacterium]
MIKKLLNERDLPNVLSFCDGKGVTKENWSERRKEIIDLISNEYGTIPEKPLSLKFNMVSEEKNFCAGKASLTKTMITSSLTRGDKFSFPVYSVVPKKEGKLKTFVLINFRDSVPDRYLPSEELCDLGYAVHSFCYTDITSDDSDYNNGLAAFFCGKEENLKRGKIALWAWAAMRVMDFVLTKPETDIDNIAVVGHSRLGKTALLAGGLDTRFSAVISNNSGCSGAALSRGKNGERIKDIFAGFPYWFKKGYGSFSKKEHLLPFDQHFLLALTAPRKLYIASATLDGWADPTSEFLAAAATSPVYEMLGVKGLIYNDLLPKENELFNKGSVGYHLRSGAHYLSRYDWNAFAKFI